MLQCPFWTLIYPCAELGKCLGLSPVLFLYFESFINGGSVSGRGKSLGIRRPRFLAKLRE